MRFSSLGSGSKGNGSLLESEKTTVLVDCGFSLKQTEFRLQRLGKEISDLSAILVTHEHGDHLNGVQRLAAKTGCSVWMTMGTARIAAQRAKCEIHEFPNLKILGGHEPFAVGDLEITPFHVPHDAQEAVQFTFSDGNHKVGHLTDTGVVTPHIIDHLQNCDALMLECNHDAVMLANGSYPPALQARVGGRLGHLSNLQAAQLVQQLDFSRFQHLALMHLSEKNNSQECATAVLSNTLGCKTGWLAVADQERGLDWREVC